VSHETNGRCIDDPRQRLEKVVFMRFVAHKVIGQIPIDLLVLLNYIREVDEESRAHVSLERGDVFLVGGPEFSDEQVAVFEQTAAADFLRLLGGDERLLQMIGGRQEVAEHGFADDGRVEVERHLHRRHVEERQHRVQIDLKRIHGKLELTPHSVHELQFHVLPAVVGQRNQAPSVRTVRHPHQLLHVGLLERRRRRDR